MRPNSRPASFIMDLTLASSVTSQCRARARTPKLARSTTVCCASRAELRKVMATSAPAWARARAEARPRRRAPPVMRQALPRSGLSGSLCMAEFYLLAHDFFRFLTISYWNRPLKGGYNPPDAGVPPGRGLLAQGMPSLRVGEGEPREALPPR